MEMKKRIVSVLLTAALAVSMLAGCGNSKDQAGKSNQTAGTG